MIKKSILIAIVRGFSALLQFLIIFYITNNFNAQTIGKYDLISSILIIFGSLCVVGMNHSIIYYSGFFKAKNSESSLWPVYKKMITILCIISVIFFLLFLLIPKNIISIIYEGDVYGLIFKTFMIIGFYALFYLNIDAFRALGKINISEVFRSILRHVVFLIFAVIIYRTNNAKHLPEALLLSFIILSIISTILVLKIFSKRIKENTKKVVVISKKEIFNKSYPMSISMIAFLFLQSTDILLLGAFNEFKDVAYYSRSVQLALLVSLVLHAVNTVYAPKIAELYTLKKYNTLNQSVRKATKLIFITSFLPILLLFFFANSFLKLFGDDYTQAAIALQVLMVGQIVNTFTGSVGMYMNMTNRQKVLQNILLITIVLNFILNFVLIPKYGMLGAAISTSFSTAGWNLFGCIYLYRNDKVKTYLH